MQPELQPVPIAQTGAPGATQDLATQSHKVLRNTYLLLALSMIPTVIGAAVGVNTSFTFLRAYPIMGPIAMLLVMLGLLFAVTKFRNSSLGVVLLLAFTFVAGLLLGPILQVALGFRNGPQLIGMAAGGTGIVFFAMSTIATVTKKDFSFLGNFLFVGLILLVVASLANLFFQVPAVALAISAVGVLIFSVYLLYDVSRIVNGGETNYVMATMSIYLDIYNLFISLLNILMALTGQRD
jgi:modulator of FtsH protease